MNDNLLNRMQAMSESELYAALYTDPLTGVNNRRAFDVAQIPIVAIVDLDSLKYINDCIGHLAGDAKLTQLGRLMQRVFGGDNVYRLGGDEFAVVGSSKDQLDLGMQSARRTFPGFSYGVGQTLPEADDQLKIDKLDRELRGHRSPRGECPPAAIMRRA